MNKGRDIKVNIVANPNFEKYRTAKLEIGSDDLFKIKDSDIFFLETLQMKANLADEIIANAESQGKDTTDPNVMKELGEEINALCKPLHRSESIMTAFFVSLRLMVPYGIAVGIWGLVFKKSFFQFGFYGVIVAILICLFSVFPVVAFQRTKERIRTVVDGIGIIHISICIIIGIVGLIALVIKLCFR